MMCTPKYVVATVSFVVAVWLLGAIGINVARNSFAGSIEKKPELQVTSNIISEQPKLTSPASKLLGSEPEGVEQSPVDTNRDSEWVEVTDAANMRSGASSADPVIKVQREGARLRVVSRDGNWINVVEPGSELQGWVYKKYVQLAEPALQSARVTDAAAE
jgi:uncharacterized protein YgiM (DUF1202 family)